MLEVTQNTNQFTPTETYTNTNNITYEDTNRLNSSDDDDDNFEVDVEVNISDDDMEEWGDIEASNVVPEIIDHPHQPVSSEDPNDPYSQGGYWYYPSKNKPRMIYRGSPGFKFRDPEDPRHFGRCMPFCYWNGNPLVVIGPDWPFSIVMIIFICGFWESSTQILILPNHVLLTSFIMYTLKSLHYGVMFTMVLKNPGIMSSHDYYVGPEVDVKGGRRPRPCETCRVISHKAEHCFRCDVCIEDVDHHCPWMNKCVAKGNLVEFYLFLGLTFGSLFYALGITFVQSQ